MQNFQAQSNQMLVYSTKQMNALFNNVRTEDDFQAFETIFHQYYHYLCSVVCRIIKCEHQAEEIVLDVFCKLWANRKKLTIDISLKALLVTSVKNRSIDYLRKKTKTNKLAQELAENDYTFYESPENSLIYKELNEEIETWIEALPPKGKRIFRLSRDYGLKYTEIADRLGISIKTVETHMRRSLITLRQKLKAYQEDQL